AWSRRSTSTAATAAAAGCPDEQMRDAAAAVLEPAAMAQERSGSVLVVEDDPAMRDLLTEELSDAGFTVEAAPTAAAGLELARVTRFDLIITDLRMPEMDGFDLIRGVMQLPEPPHVVMITAFASIE